METKSNTAVIGMFTLAVLVFAFGFIYWLATDGRGIRKEKMVVIFSGAVSGLDVGSTVTFNGIPVGDVRQLQFNSEDPSQVLARLLVNADTPIKTDSEVSLGYQGITGIAYVDISGGTRKADKLLDGSGDTFMYAKRSAFEDIVAGARQILGRADSTLKTLDDLVTENAPSVANTLGNVERFSGALADNSDEVATFIKSMSAAADGIAEISGQLKGVVAQAETLLADVDSTRVKETLDNIASASARLDGLVERSEAILAAVEPAAVKETMDKISSAAGRVDGLVGRGEEILAAVDPAKVREAVDAVSQAVGEIEAFAKQGEALLAAVDPAKVGETIDNVASASARADRLIESGEALLAAVDPELVKKASEDIANASGKLDAVLGRSAEILTAVDPKKVGETVDSIARASTGVEEFVKRGETILAAVDPEKVRQTVDGVASLSNTLTARQAEIDSVITSLSVNLQNATDFTARLPEIGKKADEILTSVDVAKINQSIENVHQFTTALGNSSEDVDAIVANIKNVSQRANDLLAKLDGIAGSDEGEGLITDARATLNSIRLAADSFTRQADSIGGGVNRFTNQGLRDLQTFVQEGRRAVSRLDRLISNIDRNPSQVLFGADNVPQYRGGQRR